MKVVWSPLALQKLGDAAEFISLDNPPAAEKWVNEVFDKTELLGSMPEMGRFVPEMPHTNCLLYTSPSPRDRQKSRMPSSA